MQQFIQAAKRLLRPIEEATGLRAARRNWMMRNSAQPAHLDPTSLADRFDKIYADGVWRHGMDDIPPSGHGSSLAATESLRETLPNLLNTLNAEVLLDIGCGDQTWMREISLNQRYIGLDIVPSLIAEHTRDLGDDRRSFAVADATVDDLPEADVVLCREVLFHLSFADIRLALANMLSKPRRFLVLTTDSIDINDEIRSGDYRQLNLRKRPFNFSAPDFSLADDAILPGRTLGVWAADRLKTWAG